MACPEIVITKFIPQATEFYANTEKVEVGVPLLYTTNLEQIGRYRGNEIYLFIGGP